MPADSNIFRKKMKIFEIFQCQRISSSESVHSWSTCEVYMLRGYKYRKLPSLGYRIKFLNTNSQIKRWQSTNGNGSKDKNNEFDAILKVNELLKMDPENAVNAQSIGTTNQSAKKDQPSGFDEFPWEFNSSTDTATDKTDEKLETDSLNDLLWSSIKDENTHTNSVNKAKNDKIMKNELILAPLKKKLTPLQRLTPRQKTPKNTKRDLLDSKVSLQIERDYLNLMQFKHSVTSEDFINVIEELKPSNNVVTIKQLTDLSNNLDKSFRVKQLRQYVEQACPEINISKTLPKKKIISKIITDYWKLKVTLDPTGDLVNETRINLSNKRDVFLLFSNRGFLPQHWSLIGAQLSFGNSSKELVVRGSKNIVNFVQASWNNLLNNISTETINLSEVMKFANNNKSGNNITIDGLQQECGVYFDKISFEENVYILSAIKKLSISQAKIEILKSLEYKSGQKRYVVEKLIDDNQNNEDLIKNNITDDTLPWYVKPDDYFRYAFTKKRISEALLMDESLIFESVHKEVLELKQQVEKAKDDFEYNYVQTDRKTHKPIEDIDLDVVSSENVSNTITTIIDVEEIASKLMLQEVEDKAEEKLILPNVTSVKYGKLLFKKEDQEKQTFFNDNLPEVVRNIGKLELMDKESRLFGITGGIMNKFSKKVYLKLIPNGFSNKEFDKFVDFPSIEILINVKDGTKLEVNNFSAFVSEKENNVDVALPYFDIDLKFQTSSNSMLIYNKDQWILNGKEEEKFTEKESIINNKKLINMYISQISKRNFDLRRTDALRGILKQFKHKPYSFEINGQSVKYTPVCVEIVQTLELDYEGLPVSYTLRDDGEHEKVEISMLKEDNVPFPTFAEKSIRFAEFLSM